MAIPAVPGLWFLFLPILFDRLSQSRCGHLRQGESRQAVDEGRRRVG
jgi:hypothetical protein